MVTYDGFDKKSVCDKVYPLNIFNGEVAPMLVINVTESQEYNCKYFAIRENRDIWLEARNAFIDYVLGFYGVGGIYADFFGEGVTRDEVILATNAIDKADKEGIIDYDSFAREMVRDYMLVSRGVEGVEFGKVVDWFKAFPPRFHRN